jgi:Phosphodiester glycosidase
MVAWEFTQKCHTTVITTGYNQDVPFLLIKPMQITTMRRWRDKPINFTQMAWIRWLLLVLLGLPIALQTIPYFHRPAPQPLTMALGPGATYERIAFTQPRSHIVHVARIDLTQPQLELLVTPGEIGTDDRELNARTTSQFLTHYQQDLAINASFFYPFNENAPWDYYPSGGDRVNAVGYAASNGKVYSDGNVPTWAVVCFNAQNQVQILAQPNCPKGTQQGLSGNELILNSGQPSTRSEKDKPYPRTIVGTDATGQRLWLIVIDGKQPWYSEGLTIAETISLLQKMGITTALNLDGGGSVAMVRSTAKGPQVLNAPIHNKIPLTERPIANHLGLRWQRS